MTSVRRRRQSVERAVMEPGGGAALGFRRRAGRGVPQPDNERLEPSYDRFRRQIR